MNLPPAASVLAGTDSFNLGQILILLLFGGSAEPPPCTDSQEFVTACSHRESLRRVLQLSPRLARNHPDHPLDPRWDSCPPVLLRLLMRQVRRKPSGYDCSSPLLHVETQCRLLMHHVLQP
jgi:hypothetical protein